MTHLYELSEQYRNLIANTDTEDLTEQSVKNKLQGITEQLNNKAENIGKLVMEINAESEVIQKEIERLANRKRVAENKAEWLKSYVLTEMLSSGIEKIEGQVLTLSLRKSPPSVTVLDQTLIPEQYFRIIPENKEVNKKAILENFKTTGEILNGTSIVTDKKTLMIR
jgi:hypothetical protein